MTFFNNSRSDLLKIFISLLIFKLIIIFSFGNKTPYWDQWSALAGNLYLPWLNGQLSHQDLLAPHNEHRIFTTRLLSLGLLIINSAIWNPLLEMYVNAAIHAIALTFLLYCVTHSISDGLKKILVIFSITLFAIPFGWENTLAGFQSQFYLLLIFSFTFLWAIACERIFSFKWWLGIIAGLLCPLSLASGALTLLVGAFILLIRHFFFRDSSGKLIYLVSVFLVVLVVISITFTPTIADHASLKVNNIKEFISALMGVAAWPIKIPYAALFVQSPIICLTFLVLTQKEWRKSSSYLYLIAVGGWVFAQFITISYGRFSGSFSSRYLDLFAVGLIINFASLLIFYERLSLGRKKLWKFILLSWPFIIFIAMFSRLPTIFNELKLKNFESSQQEKNVRAYLCTGNKSYLMNKPSQHVPFPDIEYLKGLLDNPKIKEILPGNIYEGNSPYKNNVDGSPYCDFEVLNSPFEVLSIKNFKGDEFIATDKSLIYDGWKGGDYFRTTFSGVRFIGSYVTSDSDIGTLRISLKKNDQIFYRSGPRTSRQVILINDGSGNKFSTSLPIVTDWSILHFSNPKLPDKFDLTLIDSGTSWGEWIAIGLKQKNRNEK